MNSSWIYFNEQSRKWEVRHFDGRAAVVDFEYATRSEAYRCAAWGIRGASD